MPDTKYNFSHIMKWNEMSREYLHQCVLNMMRIGMDHIGDDNIKEVIKRTQKADKCDLQIPGAPPIQKITISDIQRWKGFSSNITPYPAEEWHKMMVQLFPHVLAFDKCLRAAHKDGWIIEERANFDLPGWKGDIWWVHNSKDENAKSWVYRQDEYVLEKDVWSDLFKKRKL